MRLKSIKLAGFKSFVDATTVHFPTNLSAVVGPNGCGKSNVIDAVRWVMGESSAKNLRGQSMTDVIFNGSTGRKPVGQASIELVFDNSDHKIQGEWGRFAEVAIKRKVTRDAKNIYYINGTQCRRRDITDIFLGTGLGPRSYAIIEQGMISRLIESKPEELRVFIEEAAGISKYKERRRDTESRIKRTRENLERLTDIRDELGRQLERLAKQAASAEKFRTWRAQERELKSTILAARWHDVDRQVDIEVAKVEQLEKEIETITTNRAGAQSQIDVLKTESEALSVAHQSAQAHVYQIAAEMNRLEQAAQHAADRERSINDDLQRLAADVQQLEFQREEDTHWVERHQIELEEARPASELQQEEVALSEIKVVDALEANENARAAWNRFERVSEQVEHTRAVERQRIQQAEANIQRFEQRLFRLDAELTDMSVAEVEDDAIELREQVAIIDAQLDEVKAERHENTERIEALEGELRGYSEQLNDQQTKAQSLKGQISAVHTLLNQSDSHEQGHQQWLAEHQLDSQPKLLDRITVPALWQDAVNGILRDWLEAIEVDTLAAAYLKGTPAANWKLYQASNTAPSKGSLSEIVQGVQLAWFNRIYLAESEREAFIQLQQLPVEAQILTPSGLLLSHSGMRSVLVAEGQNFLALKAKLEQTEAQLDTVVDNIERIDALVGAGRARIDECRQKRGALVDLVDQYTASRASSYAQLAALESRLNQAVQRRQHIEAEQREITEDLELQRSMIEQGEIALLEADESEAAQLADRDEFEMELLQSQAKLEAARQYERRMRDALNEQLSALRTLDIQLNARKEALQRTDERLAGELERRAQLHEALAELAVADEVNPETIELLAEERLLADEQLVEAKIQLDNCNEKLRETEAARGDVERLVDAVRVKLEAARLAKQAVELKRQALVEQMVQQGLELRVLLELDLTDFNRADAEEEVAALAKRIQRLGAINMAAIDEYEEESERKQYLDDQDADLNKALESLEAAIKKIDRETRQRFKDTFDKVNTSLQELFPKVFGGGSALLELTGDDLLDTGVSIMARPPGKKNSTIHLLSGGEKALTAIALVFSIFRLNPAPFCMLDEVDAPLDDANVGRYARLVEEMSANVQFIYITHNKIAMEMAHQLQGVTMHEPGVSRLVSVDVDEAVSLVEA